MNKTINDLDVERDGTEKTHLANDTVHSITWKRLEVVIEPRFLSDTKQKPIIADVDGFAIAGSFSSMHITTKIAD